MAKSVQQNRCKGKTKQGKPCRAAATAGGLCFFHANPDKASELGRRGGRKNRRWVPVERAALPPLDNAGAIRDTLTRLITEAYTVQLDPTSVTGLERLLNLLLRTFGATELEQRIAALERHAEPESTRDNGTTDPSSDTEEHELKPGGKH